MFQEIPRPGAGFETGDFVKEKLGGVTVERLAGGDDVCTTATNICILHSSLKSGRSERCWAYNR